MWILRYFGSSLLARIAAQSLASSFLARPPPRKDGDEGDLSVEMATLMRDCKA